MPKNEEGEFELVLGNRQLISVFLIVVVLLGVFFSMGYIVGRNSSTATAETARNEKARPDKETEPSDGSSDQPVEQPSTPPAADSTSSAPPPVATKPAQLQPPAPEPAKPEPARGKEVKEAKEVKPKPSPSPLAAPVHAAAAGEPVSGQYWQVVATARPDAEIVAEVLGKKGFHAVLAPAPKDGIFRVLIGPLPDAATQAQSRTNLEAAGFKNPIMRKY